MAVGERPSTEENNTCQGFATLILASFAKQINFSTQLY
jgi:hypothetical protein